MIDFIPGNLNPKIISNSLSPGFSTTFSFMWLSLKLNSSKYIFLVLIKIFLIGSVSKNGISSFLFSSSSSICMIFNDFFFSMFINSFTDNKEEKYCSFSNL